MTTKDNAEASVRPIIEEALGKLSDTVVTLAKVAPDDPETAIETKALGDRRAQYARLAADPKWFENRKLVENFIAQLNAQAEAVRAKASLRRIGFWDGFGEQLAIRVRSAYDALPSAGQLLGAGALILPALAVLVVVFFFGPELKAGLKAKR